MNASERIGKAHGRVSVGVVCCGRMIYGDAGKGAGEVALGVSVDDGKQLRDIPPPLKERSHDMCE